MIKRSSLIIFAIITSFVVLFGCSSFLLSDEINAKTPEEIQEVKVDKDYTLIMDITDYDEYEVDQIIGKIIYDKENLYDGTVLKCKGQYLLLAGKPYCSFIREHVGCPNGIEFILKEGYYPSEHEKITIQGTIQHYNYVDEFGYENTGVHLVDAHYTE